VLLFLYNKNIKTKFNTSLFLIKNSESIFSSFLIFLKMEKGVIFMKDKKTNE